MMQRRSQCVLIRRVEREDVRGVTQHRNNNNNDMNMTIISLVMNMTIISLNMME